MWRLGWTFPCSQLLSFLIAILSDEMAQSSNSPHFLDVNYLSEIHEVLLTYKHLPVARGVGHEGFHVELLQLLDNQTAIREH